MVKLYGAITQLIFLETNFISVRERIEGLIPTPEMLKEISLFPGGSKIGLEYLSERDELEVRADLTKLSKEKHLKRAKIYPEASFRYWDFLTGFCIQNGHEVVFIEDKEICLKQNEVSIEGQAKNRKNKKFSEKTLELKAGLNSDEKVFMQVVRANDENYYANLLSRKINEIERADAMLRKIKSKELDAVVVASSYSDLWISNAEKIKEEHGICFDPYCAERTEEETRIRFVRDAQPEQCVSSRRESMERALRFMEEGRIIRNRKPDYVGSWELVDSPSEGYFEMFINEKNGENIKGNIEDCLGSATFTGRINDKEIGFAKRYSRNSSEDAVKGVIPYKGRKTKGGFHGFYMLPNGIGRPFYLTKSEKVNPLEISRQWFSSTKEINEQELFHELFDKIF
ncbi:hypothetical protein HYT56_03670 [Candidatus Woesearchaeota archaeon]|nr:hypothetical protein [Candidatus Woesearchaeota archaeon]